jgi:predicted ribosomally synthesized peptide with SipW-like signal peptide
MIDNTRTAARLHEWTRANSRRLQVAAVVAALGLGSAGVASMALFTDDAQVQVTATAGTLDITVNGDQGNPTPKQVTLPLSVFKPGDTTSTTLTIHNAGNLPATLTLAVAGTGPTALGAQLDATLATAGVTPAAAKANGLQLDAVPLPAGADVPVTLTLSLPTDTANSWQGVTDTLTITATATQA